jgi:hypothetical protein
VIFHSPTGTTKTSTRNTQSTFFPPFSLPLLFFIVIIRLSVWTLVRNERERERESTRARTIPVHNNNNTPEFFKKKKARAALPREIK